MEGSNDTVGIRPPFNRQQKIRYSLVVIVLFIIFVVAIFVASWNRLPEKYEIRIEDEFLGMNETESYSPKTYNNDYIRFSIQVTQGGPVDVYIIKGSEIAKYRDGEEFTSVLARENVTRADGELHVVTFASHVLFIDNQDNTRDSDAVPEGPVNYTLTYSVHDPHWWESINMWEGMLWVIGLAFVICFLAIYMIATDGIPARETERMKLVGARKPPPPLHKENPGGLQEKEREDH
jgi:hypothetical protein